MITLLPMVIGMILWNRLPEQIATHFDFEGEANGWSGRSGAVFGLYLLLFICHLFCAFVTAVDPKRKSISEKIYRIILWICPVCSIFCAVMIYGNALGYPMDVMMACSLFIGVLYIVIGNYLPKCRQNYTIGIKLPWTLNDADNWNATHRMAGPVWILDGLLLIVLGICKIGTPMLFLLAALLPAVIPCIYSFIYYQRRGSSEKIKR
jgi:uncharacterized membrane protein